MFFLALINYTWANDITDCPIHLLLFKHFSITTLYSYPSISLLTFCLPCHYISSKNLTSTLQTISSQQHNPMSDNTLNKTASRSSYYIDLSNLTILHKLHSCNQHHAYPYQYKMDSCTQPSVHQHSQHRHNLPRAHQSMMRMCTMLNETLHMMGMHREPYFFVLCKIIIS